MVKDGRVRLIACDMDGTLLGRDGKVSPGNAQALANAQKAGIGVCVASGRSPHEIEELMSGVKVSHHVLSLNGALVRARGHDDITRPLSREHLELCIDAAEDAGIVWVLYTAEGSHPSAIVERSWFREGSIVDKAGALEMCGKVLKLIGVSYDGDVEGLAKARQSAVEAGLSVSSSWTSNYEVNAPGVNKGDALCALAGVLGIGREEVMALGDYENDMQMLAWAGVSVAMGNALPGVAAVAKHRTGRNDEDGVAQAIRRLALS